MSNTSDRVVEWIKQSDYDLDTAKYMFHGGRYAYAVFMCHLSVKKAIKGLFEQRLGLIPPKTHSLVYLLTQLEIKPEKHMANLITTLSEASIATRYPESLEVLQKNYTEAAAERIIQQSEEVLLWIKGQF